MKASLAAFAGALTARAALRRVTPASPAAEDQAAAHSPVSGTANLPSRLTRQGRSGPRKLLNGWQELTARVDALAGAAPRHGAARLAESRRLPGHRLRRRISRPARPGRRAGRCGAWLRAVDRRRKASRQRHVLRRHDPRRRPEDALDARRARAPRGRRRRRRRSCR